MGKEWTKIEGPAKRSSEDFGAGEEVEFWSVPLELQDHLTVLDYLMELEMEKDDAFIEEAALLADSEDAPALLKWEQPKARPKAC